VSALLEDVRYEIAIAVDAGLQGPDLVDAIVTRLCRRIGGQAINWPMVDRRQRNAAIRRDSESGMKANEIARRHGVSRKTVNNIIGREVVQPTVGMGRDQIG